ncbi:MAG TPA: hypothetical protein VFX39_09665, partial [Gemmatimonadaceae bacterium]|nr:hypothetical protein [Gemmatimonadaceae bacterium]
MDATDRGTRSGGAPRWLIMAGVAIVLVFMAAMVTQFARASNARAAADELRGQLALSRAEATLATAALDAQRGSLQTALGLASGFFTQLQSQAATIPPALRPTVSSVLAQRDQTIGLLSRGDPESAEVLYRLLTAFRTGL